MKTAVDTNILLDIQSASTPEHEYRSYLALRKCLEQGQVVASVVVYAELSADFPSRRELDKFLAAMEVEVELISTEAAFFAGQTFALYKSSGGTRQRILADFLIAGHAARQAGRLLSRDRGFYRKYFRGLAVVEP